MRILNIAHGSLLMLGGYVAFFLFSLYHIDPVLSLPLVALIMFLFGMGVYKLVFSHIVRFPEGTKLNTSLLLSFGLILIIDTAAVELFTADHRSVTPFYTGLTLEIFNLRFPYIRIGGFVVAGIVILGLKVFLYKTYLGKSIRATAEDWEAATLMGINIGRTYLASFALGAALAAMAGSLISVSYSISPDMGMEWTLKAMIVMILAGMGSIGGVAAAGVLIGVTEAVSAIFIGPYMVVVGLVIFLLLLMFRPYGLFGRK
jgi:branched-chain amino acid transport system permease protein